MKSKEDLEITSMDQKNPVQPEQANSHKAKIGHSRMATMLSPSEIESLRQEAKADHIRMQEILAKQAKDQST